MQPAGAIVQPEQELVVGAADRSIAKTADDAIDRAILLNLDGRSVVTWPIRRVSSLRNDTVELMTYMSDPSFNH